MKKTIVFLSALSCLVAACQSDDNVMEEPVNTRVDIPLTATEKQIATQSTDFSFRLFQAVAEAQPASRILVSPLSASMALSMTANGAAGETQEEITDVLGFAGFSIGEVNEYNQKLVQNLGTLDRTATFSSANSLWLNKDFSVLNSFSQTLDTWYGAETQSRDFAAASTLQAINDWCSQKTQGLIPNMLGELKPETKAVLLNALYFKGAWEEEFDEKDTAQDTFVNENGVEQKGDFMSQKLAHRYAQNEYLSMAELYYGNGAFCMTLLLPHEGVSVEECAARLNSEEWTKLQANAGNTRLDLKLPKFTMEWKQDLCAALQAMGLQKAFGSNADFSNLSANGQLMIGGVQQANSMTVTEKGAEAASVTEIAIESSVILRPYTDFHLQRPFLFVLTEKSMGAILFIGKIGAL